MKKELQLIYDILYLIVNTIDRDYYDPYISGLTSEDYEICMNKLKEIKELMKNAEVQEEDNGTT
jgi:hypothetical protein